MLLFGAAAYASASDIEVQTETLTDVYRFSTMQQPAVLELNCDVSLELMDFFNYYNSTDILTDLDNTYDISISWDISSVDSSMPGCYEIYGTFENIPDNVIVPPKFASAVKTIYIADTSKYEIFPSSITTNYFFITWFYPILDNTSMKIWYARGDDDWQVVNLTDNSLVSLTSTHISFSRTMFAQNTLYYFQILYNNQMSNIITFYDDGTHCLTDYYNYNREPANRDGEDINDIKQDAIIDDPVINKTDDDEKETNNNSNENFSNIYTTDNEESDNQTSNNNDDNNSNNGTDDTNNSTANIRDETLPNNSEETASLTEILTDSNTTISGARVKILITQNPNWILFEKHGISVNIPTSFFKDLNMANDDLLSVTIDSVDNTTFELSIKLNDDTITSIPGTKLYFPFADSEISYICVNSSNNSKTAATYDDISKTLQFYISSTGTYHIQGDLQNAVEAFNTDFNHTQNTAQMNDNSETKTSKSTNFILFIIVITLIMLAIGGYMSICKKKGHFNDKE